MDKGYEELFGLDTFASTPVKTEVLQTTFRNNSIEIITKPTKDNDELEQINEKHAK